MQTFTLGNHNLVLVIDLPEVRDVRKRIGIDLLDQDGIGKACGSLIDFADVLAVLLAEQLDAAGLSDRDFCNLLLAGADSAVDAFLLELSDFFRRCGKAALAQLAEAIVQTSRESDRIAEELLTPETQRRLVDGHNRKERMQRQRGLEKLLRDVETPGTTSHA